MAAAGGIYRVGSWCPTVMLALVSLCPLEAAGAMGLEHGPAEWSVAQASEAPVAETLPPTVAEAVLNAIANQFSVERNHLKITDSQPRLWSDGCLGLGPIGQVCQEVLVIGWQVTVTHLRQQWVYRSNNSGSLVLFDAAGASPQTLFGPNSTTLDKAALPPLPKQVVFRVLTIDPVTQQTEETLLLKNGQLQQRQSQLQESAEQTQNIGQVPRKTVKAFRRFLQAQQFQQFDQRCYHPQPLTEKTGTVFISSRRTDLCFERSSQLHQLPSGLQTVLDQWQSLRQSGTQSLDAIRDSEHQGTEASTLQDQQE